MKIQQISIFVENKSGRLAEITQILAQANIDIRAMSVADTSDFGILRLIVNKPNEAIEALKKTGCTVSLTRVIAMGVDDEIGAFAKALKILTDNNIDIEYMYAFISRVDGKAFVILRVTNEDKAITVLKENNLTLMTEAEIYGM